MNICHIKQCKNGFTLVELITLLVILAIIAAIIIPALTGYIDKAHGMRAISYARNAYTASSCGLLDWKVAGSKGNGDKAYKINIELEIIDYLESDEMSSFTQTSNKENSIQVALSLPSYFSQGWATFITDCKTNKYKNFIRVWIGKNPDRTVGDTVKAIYYISTDGRYACRIVYDGTTKLGSDNQRTGTYYERTN